MCGFAGLLDHRNRLQDPRAAVVAMSACLAARGPDGQGEFFDSERGVALAHRRLGIFDPSDAGAQPMQSASGRFTIVWNGAVYNHLELRSELESDGHRFRGSSDTEVILAAFEAWGIDAALPRFNGMFAMAVLDTSAETGASITLVRDRVGQKPLCFASFDGLIAFASLGRAIEALPSPFGERASAIDPIALHWYLAHGAVAWPRTIRRGVERVAPGGLVRIAVASGRIERDVWWTPGEPTLEAGDLEALHDAFDRSVSYRLRGDRPIGLFLSGGIDSRLIATVAAKHNAAIPAFTLRLPGPFDETSEAAIVAQRLGLEHHIIEPTTTEVIDGATSLQELCDEPFADSSLLATSLLARAARPSIVSALGGDGGDELFGGYRRHGAAHRPRHARLARLAAALPRTLTGRWPLGRLSLAEAAERQVWANEREYAFLRSTQGAAASLMGRPQDMSEATGWLRALDTAPPPWDGVVPVHPDVREMMHADFRTYLPDDPLVKIDQGSMAVALEYRSPMLDPDVIRLAFGWPTEGLFDRAGGRVPIRRLLGQLNMPIPPAKRGFAVPLYRWLRGPLRGWAEDLLLHDPGDPIDQALVESLWRKLSGGRRDAATGVWTILCWRAWNRTRFA